MPTWSRATLPGDGLELAVGLAEERLGDAVFVVGEVEGVTALVAEEVAVDAGLVAVVAADDLAAVGGAANAEGGLAAVAAVRADGGDVVHLPGAGLVAVGAGGERAHGAGVDAHAALLAVDVGRSSGDICAGTLGAMTEELPRFWMPRAKTSMPSPHMRTQR